MPPRCWPLLRTSRGRHQHSPTLPKSAETALARPRDGPASQVLGPGHPVRPRLLVEARAPRARPHPSFDPPRRRGAAASAASARVFFGRTAVSWETYGRREERLEDGRTDDVGVAERGLGRRTARGSPKEGSEDASRRRLGRDADRPRGRCGDAAAGTVRGAIAATPRPGTRVTLVEN